MAKWEFDAAKYNSSLDNETVPVEEVDEEYDVESNWYDTEWDGNVVAQTGVKEREWMRSKIEIEDRIDKVIECLLSGKDDPDAYMSSKEIGRYLAHRNPEASIAQVHRNYSDIFNPLSCKRVTLGERQVRNKTYYSPEGVYKFMCYTTQKRREEFFDKLLKAIKGIKQ